MLHMLHTLTVDHVLEGAARGPAKHLGGLVGVCVAHRDVARPTGCELVRQLLAYMYGENVEKERGRNKEHSEVHEEEDRRIKLNRKYRQPLRVTKEKIKTQ